MKPNNRITVVGCGVSGLTTGVKLVRAGFNVEIVAQYHSPNTTSDVAAAIYFPFLAKPEDKVLDWSIDSRIEFELLARDHPESGVHIIDLLWLSKDEIKSDPEWVKAVAEPPRRARQDELPDGFRDGLVTFVPLIETPIYMPFLHSIFVSAGGIIRPPGRRIDDLSLLAAEEGSLVINCTGLGAKPLCKDESLRPVKGQVIRIEKISLQRAVGYDLDKNALAYVLPRTHDCVLGGTAEEGVWDDKPSEEQREGIRERCGVLVPSVKNARMLSEAARSRPVRDEVRVEWDPVDRRIVHNYGHGGSGFTLSWGCAQEVVKLVQIIFDPK